MSMYLTIDQVPAMLRAGYSGKKFQAEVTETVYIPADAGLWSGGSREVFTAVELATGRSVTPSWQNRFYDGRPQSQTVSLPAGTVVVRHSMFCGKDMGLKFFVHPADAAKLITAAPVELSTIEKLVLTTTAKYKPSYNGMDRYDMAKREARWDDDTYANGGGFPLRAEWDATKTALAGRGLLDKRGAITVAGRNAIGNK